MKTKYKLTAFSVLHANICLIVMLFLGVGLHRGFASCTCACRSTEATNQYDTIDYTFDGPDPVKHMSSSPPYSTAWAQGSTTQSNCNDWSCGSVPLSADIYVQCQSYAIGDYYDEITSDSSSDATITDCKSTAKFSWSGPDGTAPGAVFSVSVGADGELLASAVCSDGSSTAHATSAAVYSGSVSGENCSTPALNSFSGGVSQSSATASSGASGSFSLGSVSGGTLNVNQGTSTNNNASIHQIFSYSASETGCLEPQTPILTLFYKETVTVTSSAHGQANSINTGSYGAGSSSAWEHLSQGLDSIARCQ